ncbi:MAG: hypothetical protein A3H32_04900 [Betaproteobacteria bacterium RIFCSPLOWO2_02_FULL_63_19]|nr:MAG: hypothetical protein A3H32_04900 [Betaproteobacteria bacterium RIFCSPLOWO2_02_FULL_63_19]
MCGETASAVGFLIRISFLVAALVALPAAAEPAGVERRIDGRVLRVTVTLCQMKPRGCAGYLVLELNRLGRRQQVMVQVRMGVPIRHEDDYVLLATLPGSAVSVVHVTEKGAIVARSIEVTDIASP